MDGRPVERLAEGHVEDAGAGVIVGRCQGGRHPVGHGHTDGGLSYPAAGLVDDGSRRDHQGHGIADGSPLGGVEGGGDGPGRVALGGDIIQRDVAVLAVQYHPRVGDGRAQRLAEGYVQDAGARIVGGRGDDWRDAVCDGDSIETVVVGAEFAGCGRGDVDNV